MASTLTVSGLHANWTRRAILRGYGAQRGLSFAARDGAWIAVVGDNGVGKSTLFHALAGTAPFVTGAVYVNEARLPTRGVGARYEHGLLHVRQEPIYPRGQYWTTDAVALATTWRPALRNDRALEDLIAQLQRMGLVHGGCFTADGLDLATCIMAVPRVMMLDEVRARVASEKGAQFYAELRPLVARSIVLFTDHDVNLALDVADAVLWLRDDAAPLFGSTKELREKILLSAPVEEGPRVRTAGPIERALRVVHGEQSIRAQVDLAIRCARRGRGDRAELLAQILKVWPYMADRRPAETLSGGERVTLAWLLLHASGLGDAFPRSLMEHLSGRRRAELAIVQELLEG